MLHVEVHDKREHPGDREDTALLRLMDDDKPIMTEVIVGTSGAHASSMAHARADEIRLALGLLHCYSVSDGNVRLLEIYAVDMYDALKKIRETADVGHLSSIHIERVRDRVS